MRCAKGMNKRAPLTVVLLLGCGEEANVASRAVRTPRVFAETSPDDGHETLQIDGLPAVSCDGRRVATFQGQDDWSNGRIQRLDVPTGEVVDNLEWPQTFDEVES
jgi:hypothetical protein